MNLVTMFRSVGPPEGNPLLAERWNDLIRFKEVDDEALAEVGYELARVTNTFPDKGHLFARALDGTRDFFVPLTCTDLGRNTFGNLRSGQILRVLPSMEPPLAGSAWPAKHAMLP